MNRAMYGAFNRHPRTGLHRVSGRAHPVYGLNHLTSGMKIAECPSFSETQRELACGKINQETRGFAVKAERISVEQILGGLHKLSWKCWERRRPATWRNRGADPVSLSKAVERTGNQSGGPVLTSSRMSNGSAEATSGEAESGQDGAAGRAGRKTSPSRQINRTTRRNSPHF